MIGFLTKLRIECIQLLSILIITGSVFGSEINQKFELPEIERKSFLNGMELLFFEGAPDPLPFALMIKNGAAFDPVDKWGATYTMARMILEGLQNRYVETELSNVKIELYVEWDAIYFFGSAPEEDLEEFLIELSRVMTSSDFQEEEFEKIRSRIAEEILGEKDNPSDISKNIFFSKLFGSNPYSHPVKGSVETLNNLYLRDIKIQYRRLMLPNQTKLAIYYPGDREKFFRNLSRQWGSWVRNDPAPFTFRKSFHPESTGIFLMKHAADNSSAFLRLGFLGVDAGSRHAVTLQVLREYLTLTLPDWGEKVANEMQLQGTVELASRKMPGYFLVSIKCSPESSAAYIQTFQEEMGRLLKGELDQRRFAEAKMLVAQQYNQFLEDPVRGLEAVLRTDLYELGIHYIATFGLRIQRISPEIFQRGLQSALPGGNFIAVALVPDLEIQNNLTSLGKVELLN